MDLSAKIEQMNFSQFLEMKFLEWQRQQGGRKTVKQFAEYLGVPQSTLSTWWTNARVPEGENIQKLALKLGIETYDALGLPRPDQDLHYINSIWEDLKPAARQAIREKAERYAAQNVTRAENERKTRPKTSH